MEITIVWDLFGIFHPFPYLHIIAVKKESRNHGIGGISMSVEKNKDGSITIKDNNTMIFVFNKY